jgi:hypothetical protein
MPLNILIAIVTTAVTIDAFVNAHYKFAIFSAAVATYWLAAVVQSARLKFRRAGRSKQRVSRISQAKEKLSQTTTVTAASVAALRTPRIFASEPRSLKNPKMLADA